MDGLQIGPQHHGTSQVGPSNFEGRNSNYAAESNSLKAANTSLRNHKRQLKLQLLI